MTYQRLPTSSKDPSLGIYLYTAPLKALRKLKTNPDVFAHWAICIQGVCYEVRKARPNEPKKPKHLYAPTPLQAWLARKHEEGRTPEFFPEPMGYMYKAYSQDVIHRVATRVWERTLEKKYITDENNCQVFIRMLVELIGDQETQVRFPQSFDIWVKRAGISRDVSALTMVAGGVVMATTAATATMDPTPASMAGLAISTNLVAGSVTALSYYRYRRDKFVKDAQAELRVELASILR